MSDKDKTDNELLEAMEGLYNELINNQVEEPPEFKKVVYENFWELCYDA